MKGLMHSDREFRGYSPRGKTTFHPTILLIHAEIANQLRVGVRFTGRLPCEVVSIHGDTSSGINNGKSETRTIFVFTVRRAEIS